MISPGGSGGINRTVSTKQGSSDTHMAAVETKKPFEFDRNSQKKLQLYSETVYFDENGQPKPSGTNGGQLQSQQLSTNQNQSSQVFPAANQNELQGQPVRTQSTHVHQQNSPINSDFAQQHQMAHNQIAYLQQQSIEHQQSLLINSHATYIQQIQPVMQQPPQVYGEAVHHPMQKNFMNAYKPQPLPTRSYPPPLMQLNPNYQPHNRQHYNIHQVQKNHRYQNVMRQHHVPNGHPSYNAPLNYHNQMWQPKQMIPPSCNEYCNNQHEQNWYPPEDAHAMVNNQRCLQPTGHNTNRRAEYSYSDQSNWRKYPDTSNSRHLQMKEVATKQIRVESTVMQPPVLGTAPPSQTQAVERSREAANENLNQSSGVNQKYTPEAETIQKDVGITGPNNPNMQSKANPVPPVIQAEFNATSVDMTPSPSISPVSEDDGHVDHFPSLQQAQQQSNQKKPVLKTPTYSEKVKQGNLSGSAKVDVKKDISLVDPVEIVSTAMSPTVKKSNPKNDLHQFENNRRAVSSGFGVRDKNHTPTSHTSSSVEPGNKANVKFVRNPTIKNRNHNGFSSVEPGDTHSFFYCRPNRRHPETRRTTKQLDSIVEEKPTDQKRSSDNVIDENLVRQTEKKHAIPTIFVNGKKATPEQLSGHQKRLKPKNRRKSARDRRVDRHHNAQNKPGTADLQNIREEEEPSELKKEVNLEAEYVLLPEIKVVLDAADNLPVSEKTFGTSDEPSNTNTDECETSGLPESNTPEVTEAECTPVESHRQLNEASAEKSIIAKHSPLNEQASNDPTIQSIDTECSPKTESAKDGKKEKPAPRKSKSQKKKEKKKLKKLNATENSEFDEFEQKTQNATGPQESSSTTSEPSNPLTNRKQEKKKRIEEMKRKRFSLKFIQTTLPDYLYLGVKSLDFDCKTMAEKLVYYCHGLYQTRRCPLSLGLRDAETNTFFFEPPTGFGKEVLNYLSFRPLLHWNRIENLDDCEDYLNGKIELYKNAKDATQKELHLLYRTMSKFHYSFFYEDIFYTMSQNYDEEQAKLKDIEYLEFIEKLSSQQINDAVKTDWPTPEELQKHVTTKIGNEYCGYFINYIMRQYGCRIFFNLDSSKVHFQEDGMLNLCKTITEAAIGWSPYNTEEFYHEMLEGLKDMEQTPKVKLYEKFWKFMLEITSFICDEDVYIMQERLDCNPENIVHHDYLFKLWFGYGLLDKFEKR